MMPLTDDNERLKKENAELKERVKQLSRMYQQKAKHVSNLLKKKRNDYKDADK